MHKLIFDLHTSLRIFDDYICRNWIVLAHVSDLWTAEMKGCCRRKYLKGVRVEVEKGEGHVGGAGGANVEDGLCGGGQTKWCGEWEEVGR